MPNTNGFCTAQIPRGNHKSNPITLKKKKKKKEKKPTQNFLGNDTADEPERREVCVLPFA